MADQPKAQHPTEIVYETDYFGGPRAFRINGAPVAGVVKLVTTQCDEDYSEVTITLRGVRLTVDGVDLHAEAEAKKAAITDPVG